MLSNHIIDNLIDYAIGVEVEMDTYARKNKTGDIIKDIVYSYLLESGFEKNVTYFKELNKTDIERKFGLELSKISNDGKTEKRFDFVFIKDNHVYACKYNFYNTGGSKLNETARSYKTLSLEAKDIPNFTFILFTDGMGWNYAKHNLEETFDILETIYNLNDLESKNTVI